MAVAPPTTSREFRNKPKHVFAPSDVRTTLETLEDHLGPARVLRNVECEGRLVAAIGCWSHSGAQVDVTAARTVQLVLNLTGGQDVELHAKGRKVRSRAQAGSASVMSPEHVEEVRITGRASTVQVILSRELISRAGSEAHCTTPQALGRLQPLGIQALVALAQPRGRDERPEQLAVSLARLMPKLTATQPDRARGGLSPGARRRVRRLIRDELSRDPRRPSGLEALAATAGLSPFHFIKAFSASEGGTPRAWITRRRLDSAVSLLIEEGWTIADVADRLGFCSPSHFVSTFRRHMGVTPRRVRDAASISGVTDAWKTAIS